MAFQYWPESVSDTKAINYQQKDIPGGSLPLYQWVSGGERLITFTAIFTTDVDLTAGEDDSPLIGTTENKIVDRLESAGVRSRNADIRSAVAWLRQYMLPTYAKSSNTETRPLTKPPTKLKLVLPNSGIGLAGGNVTDVDKVLVVMTQCDVTYEAFFPSGLPRIATVALAFAEVPQEGGFIKFPSSSDMAVEVGGGSRAFTTGYRYVPK
jgi:hypothetical protein